MRYILLLLLIGGCADNQEKCPHFERFSSVPDSMFVSKAQNGLGEWMYDLKNPIWIDDSTPKSHFGKKGMRFQRIEGGKIGCFGVFGVDS